MDYDISVHCCPYVASLIFKTISKVKNYSRSLLRTISMLIYALIHNIDTIQILIT